MAGADFLQMLKISKNFDATQALRKVDFSALRGEVHAIVGENGAGKSTLMKILSGAIQATSGEIRLNGVPVELGSPVRAHRLGIRAVYQEFSLVPNISITENILMGRMPQLRVKGLIDYAAAHRLASHILEDIGFSGLDVRTPVAHLSVSHQQIVEIAKAITDHPGILILDEPSAVLSQEELKQLFSLIRRLKQESTLILYISHRLDEVFEIADRITVLKDGQLVGTVRPVETDQAGLIKMMVGRTLSEIYPHRASLPGEEILAVKALGCENSFSDVSFSLKRGEILGLFGLVGSGRTQVARCIFGADRATSGEICLNGQPVRLNSPRDAVQAGIALVTEDRKRDGLVLSCSIRDNASLAILQQVSRWILLNTSQRDELVEEEVKELSVHPTQISRLVKQLSGGNQQKVVLAKWLLSQAQVLMLDEPTRGVDVATKVEIYRIISDLAERGVGVLIISSELPEILGMSDRAIVMRKGRLAGEFKTAQASEESLLACAAGVSQ
jgi:ribose transport system ATP-binding protein